MPGQDGNTIDKALLHEWITNVRAQAKRVDRATVADVYIGHVLAHSPPDSDDGVWPPRVTREIMEELASDDVDRGIATERFNMRGVHSKALFGGGDDERGLSTQFVTWAKATRQWPRTAAMLKGLATTYRQMGADADVWAEQDRIRL